MSVGFRPKVSIAMAMLSALALALPGSSLAGQIVYAHRTGATSSLWVMTDAGNDPHSLIGDDTVDGIGNPTQPDLRAGTIALAFQGTGALPGGASGCGINCFGIYSLITGQIRRVSPAVAACSSANECGVESDSDPSLMANGQVVYDHVGSYTGGACDAYYCGPYGDDPSVFLQQSDLGGGTPTEWQTPSAITNEDQFQPTSPDAPFADPGDSNLIAYAGLEDYNCAALDVSSCDPLTLDESDGSGAYNVTDADCNFGSGGCSSSVDLTILGWSPSGKYILVSFGADSRTPGVWIFKNQPYSTSGGVGSSDAPIYGTGWWVWRPETGFTVGQGGAITSDTPGQGQVIFTYGGDIVSIAGICWAGAPTITTGKPVPDTVSPTCTQGTELTADGHDDYPTWTSSNNTISIASVPPPPTPPTSKLGRVTHSRSSVSVKIGCIGSSGRCADILGLATYETLRGSKVIAVAAAKTAHKTEIVAVKSLSIAAGKSATIKLSLDSAGRRLLSEFHKLPMLLVVVQGAKTVGAKPVTLTLPRSKRSNR